MYIWSTTCQKSFRMSHLLGPLGMLGVRKEGRKGLQSQQL